MDTATADPAARVCPRCGGEAGEQRFCGGCGLNLSGQHELPTRSEWETDRASRSSVEQQESDDPRTKVRPLLESALNDAKRWYERHSKRGKVTIIVSLVGAVVLIPVVISTASGGASQASSGVPHGYATSQQVVNALSALFHERFSSVEEGSCEIFGPANVLPEVYDCRFKIEGEWHDNIEATGHPDGSINWQDDTSGVQDLRGGNLDTSAG